MKSHNKHFLCKIEESNSSPTVAVNCSEVHCHQQRVNAYHSSTVPFFCAGFFSAVWSLPTQDWLTNPHESWRRGSCTSSSTGLRASGSCCNNGISCDSTYKQHFTVVGIFPRELFLQYCGHTVHRLASQEPNLAVWRRKWHRMESFISFRTFQKWKSKKNYSIGNS